VICFIHVIKYDITTDKIFSKLYIVKT